MSNITLILFYDRINSSFVSFLFWKTGLWGELLRFVHRSDVCVSRKQIFQMGIGLGYIVSKGNIVNQNGYNPDMNAMFLYNIGVFFLYN